MAENAKLSRRERERQRHKAEILSAAVKLFSERGFHNVSMNEIAAEAEFATGTLYNFFASKEVLYEEMMAQCAERVLSRMLPILEVGGEQERVSAFIRESVDVFRENAAEIRLAFQVAGRPKCLPSADEENIVRKHMLGRLQIKLTEIFASGIRKGLFREVDPEVPALTLLTALEAMVFSVAQDGQEELFIRRVTDLEEFFFKGILHA